MITAEFAVKADSKLLFSIEFEVNVYEGEVVAALRDGEEMAESERQVWVSAFGKDRIIERAMEAR